VSLIEGALRSSKVVFVGERQIVRMTAARGGRYTIHLPIQQNALWEELWRRGVKVRVYLEIAENGESPHT